MRSLLIALCSTVLSVGAFSQTITLPVTQLQQSVSFDDDMDLVNLELALERQLANYQNSRNSKKFNYDGKTYELADLKASTELFLIHVKDTAACLQNNADRATCYDQLSILLNRDFNVYAPVPGPGERGHGQENTTFYTAYFSPELTGSRTPDSRFVNPIYGMPTDRALRSSTREQIDFEGALAGKGFEHFWVEDSLFDIYILHVEGGGRVRIPQADGSYEYVYLSYEGSNGQPFRFISRYMTDNNLITSTSIDSQRTWLEQNPDRVRDVMASSPSYIYFRPTDHEPAGVENIPLTEGRSLAIDTRIYQHIGVVTYVQSKKSVRDHSTGRLSQVPFSRFFVSQDTGGAIRGNARCDLYFGFGEEGALQGHNTSTMGKQYFLLKK